MADWLAVATEGLCDEAQRRIRAEIMDHYAEVMEGLRAGGVAEDDSRHEALASLGDPRVARRAFRRTYLTTREAEVLKGLRSPRKNAWIFLLLLILPGFRALQHLDTPLVPLTILPGLVVMLICRLHLTPRLLRSGAVRGALILNLLVGGAICGLFWWNTVAVIGIDLASSSWVDHVISLCCLAVFAWLLAELVVDSVQAWRKSTKV